MAGCSRRPIGVPRRHAPVELDATPPSVSAFEDAKRVTSERTAGCARQAGAVELAGGWDGDVGAKTRSGLRASGLPVVHGRPERPNWREVGMGTLVRGREACEVRGVRKVGLVRAEGAKCARTGARSGGRTWRRSGAARRVYGWVAGLAQPDAYAVGPWNWLGGWNCNAPSMTRSGTTLGYGRAKQAA